MSTTPFTKAADDTPTAAGSRLPERALDALRNAVQCNCHISDARHAGDYSLCIYLLKMREYFRWEQRIPLSETLAREAVGAWLQEREELWNDVEGAGYAPLPLFGSRHDPFEAAPLNATLVEHALVYGGGLGAGGKPLFFLARLLRDETREGLRVLVTGDELARDLAAPPAMLQGATVYVRRESLRRFLWEKLEAWQWNRRNRLLGQVLDAYGFESQPDQALDTLTDALTETVTQHEIGEARAGRLLGDEWERMLLALGRSRAELTARAVRDLLADCETTLPHLLESDDPRPLDFYIATLEGLRKELFPGLATRAATGDRRLLAAAVAAGREHWREIALEILTAWRTDREGAPEAVARLAERAILH
jgi:hypothetical protein